MTPETRDMLPLAQEATVLLKALAHPARLMICCQLRGGEMSVGDMEATLGIKQPRLSRELAKLRDERLVTTRRESKVVFYRLSTDTRAQVMIDAICAVMLGKPVNSSPPSTRLPARPNRRGGYGVFATTSIKTTER